MYFHPSAYHDDNSPKDAFQHLLLEDEQFVRGTMQESFPQHFYRDSPLGKIVSDLFLKELQNSQSSVDRANERVERRSMSQ